MENHSLLDIRYARAGLTQVIEAAEPWATILTGAWGPVRTLEIIEGAQPDGEDWDRLEELHDFASSPRLRIMEAVIRWRRKTAYLDPGGALKQIEALGGQFIIPEDPTWPAQLRDLAATEPIGLWLRGRGLPDGQELSRAVAVVGSREISPYGRAATHNFVRFLRAEQRIVISGGAYGVDAAAHRTALEETERMGEKTRGSIVTIAILAGGLDKFYPASNQGLFDDIMNHGAILSELAPGIRPSRHRFLNRNRLIAALASTVLVTEARWRSGAQNTAHHALELGRAVGAVPGPFNNTASAGCHRLLLETPARLVFDHQSLQELLPEGGQPVAGVQSPSTESNPGRHVPARVQDQLTMEQQLVYDALPLRSFRSVDELCAMTGLSVPATIRVLGSLVTKKVAEEQDRKYRVLSKA